MKSTWKFTVKCQWYHSLISKILRKYQVYANKIDYHNAEYHNTLPYIKLFLLLPVIYL